jgi:hypothetical protein
MALLISCSKWVPIVVCHWGGARCAMLPPNVVATTRGPRHGAHRTLSSTGRMALARMACPPRRRGHPPWGGVACIWSGPIGWFNEARQHVHVALWTYDRFTGNNTEAYSTGNVNTCDIWGGVERCPNIIWVKYVNVFLNMGPPCNCARHIATITT